MNQTVVSQVNDTGIKLLHLLKTCKSQSHLHQIQAQITLHNLHQNSTITSHFITTCQSLNHLTTALRLYHQLHTPHPHVFISNTLIKSFSLSHTPQTSLSIYTHIHKNSFPTNHYTFPFLLKAISVLKLIHHGKIIHTQTLKLGLTSDVYVCNSLLHVYSSSGDINSCERLFDEMPERDVVSWSTMIEGYRNAGKFDEAILTFQNMQVLGVVPNRVTMIVALSACASAGAVEMGEWIHDFIRRNGWEIDVVLGTALIDIYGRCGKVDVGLEVFKSMEVKNVFTWNALIRGFALVKSGNEALRWFVMMEMEGIKPDEVTLIGVLNGCSHSGMVQTGLGIFNSMIGGKYGFLPNIKHYNCTIDMLARAGALDEAFKLVETMPFQPTKVMLGALLSGCRAHGNLRLGELAAKKLVGLEPGNGAYYVLLSNLYAEMGRWDDAEKVRSLMKEKGLEKDFGASSIEFQEGSRRHYELMAA